MSTSETTDLRIAATAEENASACASFIAEGLNKALSSNKQATLAISGGHTPTPMFQILANGKLDWSRIHLFWVDERCVPPTHEQSNFRLANEALVKPSGIPQTNVHRIRGEANPDDAAKTYIQEIQQVFSLGSGQLPSFDVLHRGMGPDAHTASLFPGEPLIENRTDIAAHIWVEKMKMDRITLLPGVLLAAKSTVLQAEGEDKAGPLYDVLLGPDDPLRFPCQIATRGAGNAVWFLDHKAAAKVMDTLNRTAKQTSGR